MNYLKLGSSLLLASTITGAKRHLITRRIKKMANEKIFELGNIVRARKIEVVTIGLGLVRNLSDLEGVIWHNADGKTVIVTKEAPEGCNYDGDRTVVVRVIDGKVLINGRFDIYAPGEDKIEKLLRKQYNLANLSEQQMCELQPLLDVASEVRPAIAPSESGRRVIVITAEMISAGVSVCYNQWEPATPCNLEEGDVFLVSDESQFKGYRIGREEFAGTHQFE